MRRWVAVFFAVWMAAGAGQADTFFMDHFTRPDGPVGNDWQVGGLGNSSIFSNELRMVTDGVVGREWILRPTGDWGGGYSSAFDDAAGTLIWRVAFTSSRNSLGGFDSGSYALAFVLGATATNLTDPAVSGYALALGNTGSPDPLRLMRFEDGLRSNTAVPTNSPPVIVAWTEPGRFNGNETIAVAITYTPATDVWTLTGATNSPSWPTLKEVHFHGEGTHAPSGEFPFMGMFFNHSTGNHFSRWDDLSVGRLAELPMEQTEEIEADQVGKTTAELLWYPGDGVGRLVAVREGAPVSVRPAPGRLYAASSVFGQGDDLGDGSRVVAIGDNTDVTLSGLIPGRSYHVRVFEYALRGGRPETAAYRTDPAGGNPYTFETDAPIIDQNSAVLPSDAPPAGGSYSSLTTNAGPDDALFAFKVLDDGDQDALPTSVARIVIRAGPSNTVDWTATFRDISLWNVFSDTYVPVTDVQITANMLVLTIPEGGLTVPNGDDHEFLLLGNLRAGTVWDGAILEFMVSAEDHGWEAHPLSSQFDAAFPEPVISAPWTLEVVATRLGFYRAPLSVFRGRPFMATVGAWDANGNRDRAVDVVVSLWDDAAMPLPGGTPKAMNGGMQSWPALRYVQPASAFTLRAEAPGLIAAETGPIAVGEPQREGSVAVVGYVSNADPDVFAFVALAHLPAGTLIYFTDNGWGANGFRGASATDGDGSEGLTAFAALAPVAPGTIIRSYETSPNHHWFTSGPIPGVSGGSWSPLAFAQSGDQLALFATATTNNPLFQREGLQPLYLFDATDGFEPVADSGTGDLLPGLEVGRTAITLPPALVWTLIMDGRPRTREAWLHYISDPQNWVSSADAPLPEGMLDVLPESGLMLIVR